jgi:PKD repeat protein
VSGVLTAMVVTVSLLMRGDASQALANPALPNAPDAIRVTVGDQPIIGLYVSNHVATPLGASSVFTAHILEGSNVSYHWEFGDGSPAQSGAVVTHTYAAPGLYFATVRASNSAGSVTHDAITSVYIPVTGLSAASSAPTRLSAHTFFTAEITAGSDAQFVWRFGDGLVATGMTASHVYSSSGIFAAQVTAFNGHSTQSATVQVTVSNAAPVAVISAPASAYVGDVVRMDAVDSFDVDQHLPLTYAWRQIAGPAVTLQDAAAATVLFTAPETAATLIFELAVTDASGLADPTPAQHVIAVKDRLRNDLTLVVESPVTLGQPAQFAASVAGGRDMLFSWDFGDGSPSQEGAAVSHLYASDGEYTVQVTASDALGTLTATARVNIRNLSPIALAGSDLTGMVRSVVQLDGGDSYDLDGHAPLRFQWRQTGGTPVLLDAPASVTPRFTAPARPGMLMFALVVTDARGAPALLPDVVVVSIEEEAAPELVVVNDSPTRLDDVTTLTATVGSDTSTHYSWRFSDGLVTHGSVVQRQFTQTGVYTAWVSAISSSAVLSASSVMTVYNLSPLAIAGDDRNADAGTWVQLNANASTDLDRHLPLQYFWVQSGGVPVQLLNPSAMTPEFVAPNGPAVLTFTLHVTDAHGLAASTPDIVVVTVTQAPFSVLNITSSSPTELGDTTYFTVTTNIGRLLQATWRFGDGASASGATASHRYRAPGVYTAYLDAQTDSKILTQQISVRIVERGVRRVFAPLLAR